MTEQKPNEPVLKTAEQLERQDRELYVALGIFIMAVGLPVLVGTYWAAQKSANAAIVNATCGGGLMLIGLGSILYGVVLGRRARRD
jgi:hypothetical protein